MKLLLHATLILWIVLYLAGCPDSPPDPPKDPAQAEPVAADANESFEPNSPVLPDTDALTITGKVVYKDLEGGFFAIDGDDGKKYNPIGLPQDYRKDGLRVKVRARLKPDAMSMHMYGIIIEIVDITAQGDL